MKLRKIIFVAFALFMITCLAGCKNRINYEGKTKVIYMLEGGKFQNCTEPIIQYYDVEAGSSMCIFDPCDLSKDEVVREEYIFDGWYETKTEQNGETVYSNKWNFDTNKISSEGITLYAKWNKKCTYTYNVCYYDENNNVVSLGKYTVEEGERFFVSSKYANRIGYTIIEYVDEQNNPWDENYKHPGGDEDLEVKVFVKYIEGNFAVVRTAKELKANKTKNIYLMNDIDFEGESFSFDNYGKIFEGNGHTISNFTVSYSAGRASLIQDFEDENQKSLCISVFGNTKGAVIRNVNFENVSFNIETTLSTTYRIYVAGIGVSLTDTTIENVSFKGNYKVVKLPSGFDDENLIIIEDNLYFIKDSSSKVENSTGLLIQNIDE